MRWGFVIVVPSSGTLKSTYNIGLLDTGRGRSSTHSDQDTLVLEVDVSDGYGCQSADDSVSGLPRHLPSLLLRDMMGCDVEDTGEIVEGRI